MTAHGTRQPGRTTSPPVMRWPYTSTVLMAIGTRNARGAFGLRSVASPSPV
jgi:hypothetical protein